MHQICTWLYTTSRWRYKKCSIWSHSRTIPSTWQDYTQWIEFSKTKPNGNS